MVHETAIIEDDVEIGQNVKIGPFCVIKKGARIADNVELKSHVIMEGKVTIGEGTIIHPFVSLSYPQTLKFKGEDSEIIIGKNNVLREYVTVQHGTLEDKMCTKIGDDCLLMVGSHIAHNCIIGNNVILANFVCLSGHVEIGDFATIGGLSAVQQFCRIGKHTMIGGCTGINKDLPPYTLANGERGYMEGLNLIGLNRRGFNKAQSLEAAKILPTIFKKSGDNSLNDRLASAKETHHSNKIIMDIIEFITTKQERPYCGFRSRK